LTVRRLVISLIAAIVVVFAVGGAVVAGAGGGSSVTRARLERSLPAEFARLYSSQAQLLGHKGVTPASLHATAMCDKGGAVEPDVGPGSNWNCLVAWTDPTNPMPPEGYGKFELDVHSNGCFTAGGPSRLVGFQTLTDTVGREVPNPVAEFDGCFDPGGDDTPTDVVFPSLLNLTTTALRPDAVGRVSVQATCGTGSAGCHGSVTATAGATSLGTVAIDLDEEQTGTLTFPTPVPRGTAEVVVAVTLTDGIGPSKPVTLPMPA
jgi:hypothetical protein